jgi:hypothetical protein
MLLILENPILQGERPDRPVFEEELHQTRLKLLADRPHVLENRITACGKQPLELILSLSARLERFLDRRPAVR